MRLCFIVVVIDLRLSLSPSVPLGVSDRLEIDCRIDDVDFAD
jgi:hypothetical protein